MQTAPGKIVFGPSRRARRLPPGSDDQKVGNVARITSQNCQQRARGHPVIG